MDFCGELKDVKCAWCGKPLKVPIEVDCDSICGENNCYAPEDYLTDEDLME